MQAIYAKGMNNEFGYKGSLPWGHNATDLQHFKDKTLGKKLLCGKNTYESLPKAVFKGREVVQVSRGDDIFEGDHSNSIIIGGTSLLTLENLERCETIWFTNVKGTFEADTYLELDWEDAFWVFIDRVNTVLHEDEVIKIVECSKVGI